MKALEIKNLSVGVGGKEILKHLNLSLKPGEIHALMGPNGSGKSTLASVIMGHPGFLIKRGGIWVYKKRLNNLDPEERAKLGVFLSFQYPVEVPGLSIENFLRLAYNNLHPHKKLSVLEFHQLFINKLKALHIRKDLAGRSLNEGFSGGEKKKWEILQMAVLEPRLAVLDETDSGLDIDALKEVTAGLKKLKQTRPGKMSVLIITHYFRILHYINPDFVHVMIDGRIVKSGRKNLANLVEKRGYDWLRNEKNAG